MNSIINLFLLIFFIAPVSLLFHEIGHAIGAKWMKVATIRITIGIGKTMWEGSLLNIQITIKKVFVFNSFTAMIGERPLQNKEKVFISLMGPIFSGILAFLLYLIYIAVPMSTIYLFYLFNLWLVVINLFPFKIGQKQSDGYTIYKLLFKTNE